MISVASGINVSSLSTISASSVSKFENATFKVDNISGDWSGQNIHVYGTTDIYGIFIITTQNIQSITQDGLAIDLTEANKGTLPHSTNGQTYTIYMAGTTIDPNTVKFKITT